METKFGKNNWAAIHAASHEELAESIACGGLGKVKANFIKNLLSEVFCKYGKFCLDHFHLQTDEEGLY
jgi:endonuclease III